MNEYEQKFKFIKNNYLVNLKSQLADFESFFKKFERTTINKESHTVSKIRIEFHKLAGSSQVFGYPLLNDYAAEIESNLDQVIEGTYNYNLRQNLIILFDKFYLEAKKAISEIVSSELPIAGKVSPEKNKHYRICSVDDDTIIGKLLEIGLTNTEYHLTLFTNGSDLLKHLEHCSYPEQPDLILLDIDMPSMTGNDILYIIKGNRKLKHIPVIMITGNKSDLTVVTSRSAGAYDYITKPFKIDFFLDYLNKFFEEKEKKQEQEKRQVAHPM